MISMGRDLIFLIYLDKYQLDFTLSYVRASDSRTLHIYQGLSCLWRHNNARMIIFLTWFHHSFHEICATLEAIGSNRLFWNIMQQTLLEQNLFFPLIYRGLTYFGRSYLNSWFMLFFRNNYPSWKTSTARIYNFWLPLFLIREYMGWNGKKYFPHLGRKSQPLLIHGSLNYTQFKCRNDIGDLSWSFMIVQ